MSTKAGNSQCQILEYMSKYSHEEILQFAWSTAGVNLEQNSRWGCSNLGLAPSTLQLYNPFTRSVLVHIFFKAKHTSLQARQSCFPSGKYFFISQSWEVSAQTRSCRRKHTPHPGPFTGTTNQNSSTTLRWCSIAELQIPLSTKLNP